MNFVVRMHVVILIVTDLYITAFFFLIFRNVLSLLNYLRFVYHKELFLCITSMVQGGKRILVNVTELVQEAFQLQVATHNWAVFTEHPTTVAPV